MLGGLLIPIVVIGLALAVLGVIVGFARNYRKCAPNEVLVVYGRKRKLTITDANGEPREIERGYRLVVGGATFVMPMIESCETIRLSTFQVATRVTDTPNIDGVPVDVEAIANMKISSDAGLLAAAVERLLEMKQEKLEQLASSTLEGHLRQIVGTLKIEQMIQDRESIQHNVLTVAKGELNKLGFDLDNFVITKIGDKHQYIESLGKSRTAQVKRDAAIAEAEAQREQDIKTAEAQQAGQLAQAAARTKISDAERQRDMQIADNQTQVKRRQARIEIEAQTAGEEARADLEQKRVAANMAKTVAETELQLKEQKRKEAELEATTVTTARKEKEARIIRAEAEQAAALLEGEALRIKAEKAGQGTQAKLSAEAVGRKAAATADQAEQEAAANGQRAKLIAAADGKKADGEAEGAAKFAILSAEAEGLEKKNRALAQLSDGARLIMILERVPEIIERAGDAGEKIVGSAFEHVGAGLARIDEVRILDMGGAKNGDGTSSVANFALNVPKIVAGTLAQFKALGIDPEQLLKKLGLDGTKFEAALGNAILGAARHAPGEAGSEEAEERADSLPR